MKLSDAAVLGAATWKRICGPAEKGAYPRPDSYKTEGCFLQLALRAVGFSAEEVSDGINWAKLTAATWPWTEKTPSPISDSHASRIWHMNDENVPFEQILAYVRANEPPEPSAATESELAFERIETDFHDSRANTR